VHTVVVVAGGDPVDPELLDSVPSDAFVIAADSGFDLARAIGLDVDLVVGDLDSLSPAGMTLVERRDIPVERHPAAKDLTDLALALDAAAARAPDRVLVLGGHGGRLDHLLANALLLASPAYDAFALVARMGEATVTVVRHDTTITGEPGELVSLLPAHGVAAGVSTEGLLFPLRDEDLHPGSTRGVSNQLTSSSARIQVRAGVLLAVQTGQLGAIEQE
jgi:thiamine pyrophosphokinase